MRQPPRQPPCAAAASSSPRPFFSTSRRPRQPLAAPPPPPAGSAAADEIDEIEADVFNKYTTTLESLQTYHGTLVDLKGVTAERERALVAYKAALKRSLQTIKEEVAVRVAQKEAKEAQRPEWKRQQEKREWRAESTTSRSGDGSHHRWTEEGQMERTSRAGFKVGSGRLSPQPPGGRIRGMSMAALTAGGAAVSSPTRIRGSGSESKKGTSVRRIGMDHYMTPQGGIKPIQTVKVTLL